jgi:hypothetical protein
MAVFWVVVLCSLLEAASTSETSVIFYQTTSHNNPEDSHFRTHCRENLKSHKEPCFISYINLRVNGFRVNVSDRKKGVLSIKNEFTLQLQENPLRRVTRAQTRACGGRVQVRISFFSSYLPKLQVSNLDAGNA